MFGGQGSRVMLEIAQRLGRSNLPLQLILMCGRNESLAARLRSAGEPAVDGGASATALPVKGEKPGIVMGDMVELTAVVKAVDLKRHEATLLFLDGTTKTVPVRPDVDLTKARLGEQVVIRSTRTMALLVEKP